jgi:hypothetical protein
MVRLPFSKPKIENVTAAAAAVELADGDKELVEAGGGDGGDRGAVGDVGEAGDCGDYAKDLD